jgi:hypothetical protein
MHHVKWIPYHISKAHSPVADGDMEDSFEYDE